MLTPSKIVCVGRNYADHAAELGNDVPDAPILFIKPPSSLRTFEQGIVLPDNLGECHFECELSIQIGQTLSHATPEQAKAAISGVTLGLDLTLRDLQNTLKDKGHPWERAKAFDGACLLGSWLGLDVLNDLNDTAFSLHINNELCQKANTRLMIFNVIDLVVDISKCFTLTAGDVIMTGTPAGVAALKSNDNLQLSLDTVMGQIHWNTAVL